MDSNMKVYNYMVGRIVATILIGAGFLIGSLLFAAFYSTGYSLLQQIVIVLVALIAACAIISIMWVVWMKKGMKEFKIKAWQK